MSIHLTIRVKLILIWEKYAFEKADGGLIMNESHFEQEVCAIAARNQAILHRHILIKGDTHCILFAHYCKSTLFYKDFLNVTRATFAVNRIANRNIKQIKRLLQKQDIKKVWTKGVFSVYGDFRPLAVKAGFGAWGENGLIVNEKYGSDFLLSAIFFK